MSRLLFIALIFGLAYWLIRSYRKNAERPEQPPQAEEMVRCKLCGLHIPRNDSITQADQFFCCDEHRRQFNQSR